MKKIYIYLASLVVLILAGSCVVFATNRIEENTSDMNISTSLISKIPTTAVTMEDSYIDQIYKKSGKYFEKIEQNDSKTLNATATNNVNTIYERNITDAEAIEIAKRHIAGALENKNVEPKVEFLLYSNIVRGIEQRPVLTVTFDDVMVGTSTDDKPSTIETKILIDSLTGDVISLMSVGHN